MRTPQTEGEWDLLSADPENYTIYNVVADDNVNEELYAYYTDKNGIKHLLDPQTYQEFRFLTSDGKFHEVF